MKAGKFRNAKVFCESPGAHRKGSRDAKGAFAPITPPLASCAAFPHFGVTAQRNLNRIGKISFKHQQRGPPWLGKEKSL